MKNLDRLKKGEFNTMNQEWLSDDDVRIIMTKRGVKGVFKLRVKNLYKPKEKEVDYETGEDIA